MGLDNLKTQMLKWRHTLHRNPEFGFQTEKTAAFVVAKLKSFGFNDISTGIGGTGVVGTLRNGTSNKAIAIRADMDALMIREQNEFDHKSEVPGYMHACGHDGHTTILLGTAALLAETHEFDGIIHFIFQPAEEWGKGAQAMIDDGLLEKFNFDEIWGFHNMPGMAVGSFETKPGPIMSAEDNFEIELRGVGGHASKPQAGRETLQPACSLVTELQTIVSRKISPADIAVLSVTQLWTDGARNILPGVSRISGDTRSFRAEVSNKIEEEMTTITAAIASAHGLEFNINYTREFIPLINDNDLAEEALEIGQLTFGRDKAKIATQPVTGSEDFAKFLNHVPGCYVFLGNGIKSAPLHNSSYDFNDDALEHGVSYFVNLVKKRLKSQ